jgi:hypothetical protein
MIAPNRQRLLLDRLEARVRLTWQREIARSMRASAAEYGRTESIAMAMGEHKERVGRIIQTTYEVAAREFAKPFYEKAAERGMVTKDFDNFLRFMAGFIGTVGAIKVSQISDTTEDQIRQAINAGVAEGLSLPQIAAEIRARAPQIASVRSAVIARTETHSAAMWAQVEAVRETGLELRKEWVAAQDERTRIDHSSADGQIVGFDESFEIGGELLAFPGDPNGSAENIINCRCVMNFVE